MYEMDMRCGIEHLIAKYVVLFYIGKNEKQLDQIHCFTEFI